MKKEQVKEWLDKIKVGDYVAFDIFEGYDISYEKITKISKRTFCVGIYQTKYSRITGRTSSIWFLKQARPLSKDEKRKLKNKELLGNTKDLMYYLGNSHCCLSELQNSFLKNLNNEIKKEIQRCKKISKNKELEKWEKEDNEPFEFPGLSKEIETLAKAKEDKSYEDSNGFGNLMRGRKEAMDDERI